MTPFEVYKEYLAIKRHFNSKTYNYVTYNGKVSVKKETFDKRKDRFFFEKLSKHDDPKSFLLANFLDNPKGWIKELSYGESAKRIYDDWLKKNQSLVYTITNDLEKFDEDFNQNFKAQNHEHPKIIKLYLGKSISFETLVIMCDMVGCLNYWEKTLKNDPIIEEIIFKIKKYLPFIYYDKEKLRKICLDKFEIV